MASTNKIIAVVGATGSQGSSVAHTFLNLSGWHVRCLTRDPSSPAAQELAALGAEVVQADLADPSSLSKAFADVNAIFLNTDYWGPYIEAKRAAATLIEKASPTSEEIAFETQILHGKNAARAAAAVSSLECFVYSALPSLKKSSDGKYSSYHVDSKAGVVDYIYEEQPELAKKTSLIYLGAYTTNQLIFPRLDPASGRHKYNLPFPDTVKMPIIDPKTSTGPFVRALIEDEKAGTNLMAYDSYWSFAELREQWSKASGKEADYEQVTTEVMHQSSGIPMDILVALDALAEFGYMGSIQYIEPYQLKKKVVTRSFETWLSERNWDDVLHENAVKPKMRSMEV